MVMYRDFATRKARELGISGQVHNEENGMVTVIAEGEETKLLELIIRLKEGSLFSRVDDVTVHWGNALEEFTTFDIRY